MKWHDQYAKKKREKNTQEQGALMWMQQTVHANISVCIRQGHGPDQDIQVCLLFTKQNN